MTLVMLKGGPAHGATVELHSEGSLQVSGHGVPDGYVARYRPLDGRKRDNTVYRFDSLSKVLARIPIPGAQS
jgi:hypothetical protein